MEDEENAEHPYAFSIDFISGILGGSAGVLAGHPLDTIKVRLQSQTAGNKTSMSTLVKDIARQEGLRGFFKGMASPLIGVAAINSLLFSAYGSALRLVSESPRYPTISEIFMAGSLSGFINAFFSTPMELVKIRLQNQANVEGYKGPIDCIRTIIKTDGLSGLFRGFNSTIIRETPSYGAYFASYEYFCRSIPGIHDPSNPTSAHVIAGGIAGIVGWCSTYPFDVVKTRLQSVEEANTKKYHGTYNAFKTIYREEGSRVFFRGIGATCIRAFPTNAATFYVVGFVRHTLHDTL